MAQDANRSSMRRWLIAIAVMSSAVMEVLDTSVVNVSLPHIAGSLSSTVDEATWVLTSYLVANAGIWTSPRGIGSTRLCMPLTGLLTSYRSLTRQTEHSLQSLLFHQGSNWHIAGRQAVAALYGNLQHQASLMSFVDIFRIMGVLFLVPIPVVLIARKPSGAKRAVAAH